MATIQQVAYRQECQEHVERGYPQATQECIDTCKFVNMKTLVNGCSFSRGPISWPYHLQAVDQSQLSNLACAGAGNTYIFESTLQEICQRSYDMVLIMWTGISRVDLLIEDKNYFNDSAYTSAFQKTQNDWVEKIIEPINDQDYVNSDWIFGCGHINQEKFLTQTKVFEGIYRHVGPNQFLFHLGIKIIALQSVLKYNKIPYIFMFYQPFDQEFKKYPYLFDNIDWNNFYVKQNIFSMAQKNQDFDDTNHPGLITNREWAQLIDNQLYQGK